MYLATPNIACTLTLKYTFEPVYVYRTGSGFTSVYVTLGVNMNTITIYGSTTLLLAGVLLKTTVNTQCVMQGHDNYIRSYAYLLAGHLSLFFFSP